MTGVGPFRPFAALQHRGSYWGYTGPTADTAESTRLTPERSFTSSELPATANSATTGLASA